MVIGIDLGRPRNSTEPPEVRIASSASGKDSSRKSHQSMRSRLAQHQTAREQLNDQDTGIAGSSESLTRTSSERSSEETPSRRLPAATVRVASPSGETTSVPPAPESATDPVVVSASPPPHADTTSANATSEIPRLTAQPPKQVECDANTSTVAKSGPETVTSHQSPGRAAHSCPRCRCPSPDRLPSMASG